jgi:hypothetical protein
MFRERPVRILLAAAALVAVAVAQVVWYTASRLALVAQCGEACAGDFEPIQTFGASVVLLGLATALVVRPRVFRLPTAVASAGLAIPWIDRSSMADTPPGLQVGFVLVLGVVLGAGLASLGLRRTEPGEAASLIAPA